MFWDGRRSFQNSMALFLGNTCGVCTIGPIAKAQMFARARIERENRTEKDKMG